MNFIRLYRKKHLRDDFPKALQYYFDAYFTYLEICYESSCLSLKNKIQTFIARRALILALGIIFLLYVAVLGDSLGPWKPWLSVFKVFVSDFNKFVIARFNFSSIKSSLSRSSFI